MHPDHDRCHNYMLVGLWPLAIHPSIRAGSHVVDLCEPKQHLARGPLNHADKQASAMESDGVRIRWPPIR